MRVRKDYAAKLRRFGESAIGIQNCLRTYLNPYKYNKNLDPNFNINNNKYGTE